MSSTNRGAKRRPNDHYPTPAWVTRAILPHLPSGGVFDPCCGEGAILDVAQSAGFLTAGLEIDPALGNVAESKGHNVWFEDALRSEWPASPCIITNPPFSRALQFVVRALDFAHEWRASVAMLLRLSFLESAKRAAFHRANPSDVYVFANRPSFAFSLSCRDECGYEAMSLERLTACPVCAGKLDISSNDSCAYAWFVWGPGRGGRIYVLDDADPSRRKRGA